jgi:tetratricopeptide (TPR) repeat protein
MTDPRTDKKFFLFTCLALALGTLALYWPVTSFPFIRFDDNEYIYENPVTQAGLTWSGFVWAFNGIHVGNWHPLSWLSHMLDCQLFGLNAGGHHFVNVLFHCANALLLFLFLRATTGAHWRSAVVAALFAWHPLHVESVAWVAERKDELSTFFWLLTLMAYARYVLGSDKWRVASDKPAAPLVTRHSSLFYSLALAFCALAMLSKPMAVTLPFTLLLVDVWPLRRVEGCRLKVTGSVTPTFNFQLSTFNRLLIEKIPFFLLSFVLCTVTYLAQRTAGAVSAVELSSRLGNVPVAYARYVANAFWPSDLAIVYPYVYRWPSAAIAGAVLLLLLISALAIRLLRQRPWLASGWLWFLGTLVPVIGFVQVGAQSMADRYFYIPSIGLFIVLVWSAADFCASRPNGRIILSLIGGSALVGCALATSVQISYWRDSETLFLHALDVTRNNYVAANALGKVYEMNGQNVRALVLYREAVRIEPRYANGQYNLGLCLIGFGLNDQAFEHLAAAAQNDPGNADAQYNLGIFFLQNKRWAEAAHGFEATLRLRPEFAPAHLHLAEALVALGKFPEAAAQYREALRRQPDVAEQKKLEELLTAHPEIH